MEGFTRMLTAALLCQAAVFAFAPAANLATATSRRGYLVTTQSTSSPDYETRKGDAVDALEKLLKRQKSDIKDTENLLNRLKNWETTGDDEESFTRVSTILSGFDYGFRSRSDGAYSRLSGGLKDAKGTAFDQYGPPANIVILGLQQLQRNWKAIQGEYNDEEEIVLTPKQRELRAKLKELTLNSTAIWEREQADGPIDAPFVIKIPYLVLCWFLDVLFEGKYVFSRFFLLETVARMPYFSYIGMLQFYETLGFWRRSSDVKRIHFSQEWNEFHHLLVMESLGGDQQWWVRFVAQHSAIVYFFVLCALWALSPSLAYKFSELLEIHAVNTYGGLLDENEEKLKELPPSMAAIDYYSLGGSDPLFGEYQTTALLGGSEIRKPGKDMQSLYEVFRAIQADEGDHVGTMQACLDPEVAVLSPSLEQKLLSGAALAVLVGATGDFSSLNDLASLNDFVDASGGLDGLADGLSADSVMDAALAGGAALMSQAEMDVEERNVLGLATEALELGSIGVLLESVRLVVINVLVRLAEFLAALL